jgi:hypothetical protein
MHIINLNAAYTKVYRGHLCLYIKKEGGRITRTGEYVFRFKSYPITADIFRFRMTFSRHPDMSSEIEWAMLPDGKTYVHNFPVISNTPLIFPCTTGKKPKTGK